MEMTQESPVQKENAAPKQPALPPVQNENAAAKQPALPPVHNENTAQKQQTLPPPLTKPSLCSKTTIPDRLKVPKAFKYPERYTSPTDQMMSPVSKRLFGNGRTRKPATAAVAAAATAPLPPSGNPPKPVKIQPQTLSSSPNLISIDT
ncbi:PREDICTED: WAS/WASL-interacting protein family member 1 [Ipomoea nil]|uniref:WAS/WASL-interacting protein family member 1 n=1 Tax=Ipomoea nil TaxID=35883 RepID=UPI000901B7C5|nr:PREDICTED: WAS/WASL-interacting protein family member 1 [Ipomoea nil]